MLEVADNRGKAKPARAAGAGKVLLALHGEGRGRSSSFLGYLRERILATRPALATRLLVWRTGRPLPPLDGVRAIVFRLGDPISAYPACEAEALRLAAAAEERGIRVLNHPKSLNNTVKSRQSELWRAAGIPCAQGWAAGDESEVRSALKQARYPIILRSDDLHIQEGARVCRDQAEALRHLADVRFPAAVLEFVDTRESWRAAQPESIYAEYFHKRRSMVFGSRVINNHAFFSTSPIVGAKSCTFGDPDAPRLQETIAADIAYHDSPPEAPELMRAATRALGVDFAAIDYSTNADGSIVLWEANPYFRLPHWTQAFLPEERRLKERIPRMIDAMLDELDALTESVDA